MAISGQVLTISLVVVSTTAFIFVKRILRIGQREPLLPPGPPTKPILGNLTILPIKDSYAKFTEWAKQYGGIYSLKVSSNTIIVVSSFDAVYNVMEKNGLKTANRPVRSHSIRIFGDQGSLAVVQYGPSLRTWRRAASEMLSPTACDRHMPILMSEINQLMNDLLDHPETFMKDIERAILSSAFSTIFGIRTPSIESWEAQTFLRATNEFFRLSAPGEVPPVDLFPILNYIPDRYVRNWRARCDAVRRDQEALWFSLVDKAQERLNRGSTNGCLSETLINRAEGWDLDRRIIACMAGNLLIGAAHTTVGLLHWVVLLASIHQDKQEKMREELDRVVGPDRIPDDKDLPKLPYLRAFIREVLRFRPVLPLAIPHAAGEDQLYQGYLIPKGCTIILNLWAILHDPNLFEDPDVFNPDRYINIEASKADLYKKLESLPFGTGRRICPGMSLANRMVELTVASLIWGFHFSPRREGDLHENNFIMSATCNPKPFQCDVKPRSTLKAKIIKEKLPSSQSIFERFV